MKPTAIICDIDGTLAHIVDRNSHDYTKVNTDIVDHVVRSILKKFKHDHSIILISCRDDSCYDETVNWLINNNVPYDDLYLRSQNDNRKDIIVKKEIYDNKIKDYYTVFFVLEDRNSVVEMSR